MAARERTSASRWQRLTAGDRPFVYLFIGLLVLLGVMAAGPLQSYTSAADRVDRLEVTRSTLQGEVDRLEDRREQLEDPGELEVLARQELGMVKEGEVPFVVVTPEAEIDTLGPESPQETAPDDTWYRRLGRALADLFG